MDTCPLVWVFEISVCTKISSFMLEQLFYNLKVVLSNRFEHLEVIFFFRVPPALPCVFMSSLEFIEVFLVVCLRECINFINLSDVIDHTWKEKEKRERNEILELKEIRKGLDIGVLPVSWSLMRNISYGSFSLILISLDVFLCLTGEVDDELSSWIGPYRVYYELKGVLET